MRRASPGSRWPRVPRGFAAGGRPNTCETERWDWRLRLAVAVTRTVESRCGKETQRSKRRFDGWRTATSFPFTRTAIRRVPAGAVPATWPNETS